MINYVLKSVRHPSFFKKYAAKKFMKVRHLSHLCQFSLTQLDEPRQARTCAHGLLSGGQRTRLSILRKSFLRSRRSSALSARARLPQASTQMRLILWRKADCRFSHSLSVSTHRQSISTHLFICQYSPQSPSDQPSSMNVQCPSRPTRQLTPELHVFITSTCSSQLFVHVYDSRPLHGTIPFFPPN